MPTRPALIALLALYFIIGSLYATQTPAWQVPDEPAHYNYIRFIAEQRALPVLSPGDYDADYLEQLKSQKFPPELSIESIRYESWQPPLYYLGAAPLFAMTNGEVMALRLFSLALGGLGLVLVFMLGQLLFPNEPLLALTLAGLWAFIPQHLAMLAGINNDALADVLMAAALVLCVKLLLGPNPSVQLLLGLGGVLGAAFVGKLSVYPLAAIIGVAVLLKARRAQWDLRTLCQALLWVYAPALLLGGLWWGRNLLVYGGLDFLGAGRHDAVVTGQLRTVDAIAQWGWPLYLSRFWETTFHSFWGQFGWMGVVMDGRVYMALGFYSLGLLVGFWGWAWARVSTRPSPEQQDVLVVLLVTLLLAVTVYLYYNFTFVQFQGRYLYPALSVLALGMALSLRQWARWFQALFNRVPRATPSTALMRLNQLATPVLAYLPLTVVGLLALLALFALYRFIVPALGR